MPRFSNRIFKKRKSTKNVEKTCETDTAPCSSKVNKSLEIIDYDKYLNYNSSRNEIIDIQLLSAAIGEFVCCKICKNETVSLKVNRSVQGLTSELKLYCSNCEHEQRFLNTKHTLKNINGKSSKVYELNTRLFYGMRVIGKGEIGAKVFCGIMNLPSPSVRYHEGRNILLETVKTVSEDCMSAAAYEAKTMNENSADIAVALDGSWQKRGHVSLNGIVSATSVDTGKVVDIEIFSKYCKCPDKKSHNVNCTANYRGKSGGMEVAGAKSIFMRSIDLHGLRYTKYLGDGDSRAYKSVCEIQPYGTDVEISKLECVGHVEKRMGTRLRLLKTKMKNQKLSDGKPLGGKGRLTDSIIDKLQLFYGLAIRKNTHDIKAMKRAVWAVYFHKMSTDDAPQHGLCPSDDSSWCGYNKVQLNGGNYSHKNNLPLAVMECIKPIFRDLAEPSLLKKCLHGKTQNCNESLNSVIWKRLPKSVFVQIDTLKLGVFDAVATFNEGNIIRCKVMSKLGFSPGVNMCVAMKTADELRLRKAEYALQQSTKDARIKRRQKKLQLEDIATDKNYVPAYGAGMH